MNMYDNKIEIQEDYLDYEFLDDWQNYNAPLKNVME